jgi:hypothetical protein
LPQNAVQQTGFQLTTAGRHMRDSIFAFDPDMAAPCSSQGQALAAARDDPDVTASAQSPKHFVCRHPDRSTDLRINRRREVSN